MAIDSTPSTVATNALSAIPYAALIGGPLDACIKAQATSAMTTVDFIKKVGFKKGPTGEDEVVNVVFQYVRDGQRLNLIVPLLAIVPVPYIGIDAITIDFKAKISAESSSVNEDTESTAFAGEASGEASLGVGPFKIKVNFKASYSSKKDSKATQQSKYSVEYTMDIHVAASQADMPAGLAKVLNILESNVNALPAAGSLVAKPVEVKVVAGKETKVPVEILVLDGVGNAKANVTVAPGTAAAKEPSGAITTNNGEQGGGLAKGEITVAADVEPGTYAVKFTGTPDGGAQKSAIVRVEVSKS